MDNPTFIVTTADDENVIDVIIVQDDQSWEAIFTSQCEAYGVQPTEETFNEGVMHLEDGTSIWIAQVATQL